MNRTRPIIVFGARGLAGTALMEVMGDQEVIGFDLESGSDIEVCDATQPDTVSKTVREIRPGVIVNAVGYTDVDGCETDIDRAYELNARVPESLARSASQAGAFFVHLSTDFIFDGASTAPYLENDAPNPLSVYGQSKLVGEEAVRAAGGDWLIIRTAWLFGHGGNDFIHTVLNLVKDKKNLRIVSDQTGSPTYAQDLASGILKLMAAEARGTVHLVNSGYTTWFELARRLLDLTGFKKVPIQAIDSYELDRPASRPSFSALDTTRFNKLTGSKPRMWDEALAACLAREGLIK